MKLSDLKGDYTVEEPSENVSEESSPKLKLSDLKDYKVEEPEPERTLASEAEKVAQTSESNLPKINALEAIVIAANA